MCYGVGSAVGTVGPIGAGGKSLHVPKLLVQVVLCFVKDRAAAWLEDLYPALLACFLL